MRVPAAVVLMLLATAPRADGAAPAPVPDFTFDSAARWSASLLTLTGDAFLIDVTIGGRGPYPFALDTGGEDAIDPELARELGVTPTGMGEVQGAGPVTVTAGLVTLPSVEIGHLTLHDRPFRVLTLGVPAENYVPPYRGLIGHALFDRLVVHIDLDGGSVVLSDPEGWTYRGDGKVMNFDFHGHLPVVSGSIDGIPGRFTLDTGQVNSLTLFQPFLVAHKLEDFWPPRFTAKVGWGIGGDIEADVARGTLLRLGDVQVDRPVLYLSHQKTGAFADPEIAGNVGEGVFMRFNVTFNYLQRRAWFERTRNYGREDDVHLMTLKRSFGGFTVLSVLPGGAAALAGLRPGDVLEAIDGHDATRLEDYDLQRIFRRGPGTKVALQVRTGGHLRNLEMELRPSV